MFLSLRSAWDFVTKLELKNVADDFKNIQQWWNDHDQGIRQFQALSTSGQLRTGTRSVTANTVLGFPDHVVFVDTTSSNLTVTLPTAKGIRGQQYIVINTGTKIVTISTTSSQTINGGTSFGLPAQYFAVTLISDGSNWLAI